MHVLDKAGEVRSTTKRPTGIDPLLAWTNNPLYLTGPERITTSVDTNVCNTVACGVIYPSENKYKSIFLTISYHMHRIGRDVRCEHGQDRIFFYSSERSGIIGQNDD